MKEFLTTFGIMLAVVIPVLAVYYLFFGYLFPETDAMTEEERTKHWRIESSVCLAAMLALWAAAFFMTNDGLQLGLINSGSALVIWSAARHYRRMERLGRKN